MEKTTLITAMKTAVSVTGNRNCIRGTATSARPKPVNPLTTEAIKMISDRARMFPAVIMLFVVQCHLPELGIEFLY